MKQDRGKRFEEIARAVGGRDGGRCRRCGEPEGDQRLHIHHIVPDTKLSDEYDAHLPVNLISLCEKCHPKMESMNYSRQLKELDVEKHSDLMLSEEHRKNLNGRLDNIGPEFLNTQKVSVEKSREIIEKASVISLTAPEKQAELSEFD